MTQLVNVTQHDGIAVVTINNPPVNALSHATRSALLAALKDRFEASGVEALVIACEGRTFIAGADIREFGKPPLAPDLPELVEFLDGAPIPTIAAIHGTALGGGLELALACDFRVATESAKLGLPEVALGILPGAGGTQRLPRLIGVRAALEMIVSGVPISAAEARRNGLVDEFIAGDLKESAVAFTRRVLAVQRPRRRLSSLSVTSEALGVFEDYARISADRWRGYLAPSRCIEAVRAAVTLPFSEGLRRERELFQELVASAESKAQRHVFFGEREVAKVPELPDDTPTRVVKSVVVLGAASARGLARCFADARIPVTLLMDEPRESESVLSAVREDYLRAVSQGRLSRTECDARLELIRSTHSETDARGADLWVEAVADEPEAKRRALARLDALAKPAAILASTTKSLALEALAKITSRPGDVVGMCFASPIEQVKLLECSRTPRTLPDALATVMKLGRALGKVTVAVRGHVSNRLLASYVREALFLLEEGALPQEVDLALTEFGFRTGPFSALDLVGYEAILEERRARFAQLTARERACSLLEDLTRLGRTGRSCGLGFYRYDGDRVAPDPAIVPLLERHSKARATARRTISSEEIRERCVLSVINEAARILEEGGAARPLEIDLIWVHGFSFPPYRGGPLFHADQLGLGQVTERMLRFREQLGEEYWTPAPLIERLRASGQGFYRGS